MIANVEDLNEKAIFRVQVWKFDTKVQNMVTERDFLIINEALDWGIEFCNIC